jgi:hypothetical protein
MDHGDGATDFQKPVFNFAPRGKIWPPGVKLTPGEDFVTQGRPYPPRSPREEFDPYWRGWHQRRFFDRINYKICQISLKYLLQMFRCKICQHFLNSLVSLCRYGQKTCLTEMCICTFLPSYVWRCKKQERSEKDLREKMFLLTDLLKSSECILFPFFRSVKESLNDNNSLHLLFPHTSPAQKFLALELLITSGQNTAPFLQHTCR